MPKPIPARIQALDYLRGFFIVVIIVDHLFRFPNIFMFISGEARLWMTAAEGFIMISGLLIGYIRGFKGLKRPFSNIANTLFRRAVLLYVWLVIGSILYLGVAVWILRIPRTPSPSVPAGDWGGLISNIVTMEHPAVWVHFLYLYTIFLLISIPVVWLLRHQKAWLVLLLSVPLYVFGWLNDIEWMKWQLLFFGAAVAGFYLDSIRMWWSNIGTSKQRLLQTTLYVITATTLVGSIVSVYLPGILPGQLVTNLENIFAIDIFGPARLVIAILWFTTLCLVFERIYPFLKRYTYGMLEYFGTHSLTAYVAHGAIICLLNALIPLSDSAIINSLVVLVGIMFVYGLIRLPIIRTVLPR